MFMIITILAITAVFCLQDIVGIETGFYRVEGTETI